MSKTEPNSATGNGNASPGLLFDAVSANTVRSYGRRHSHTCLCAPASSQLPNASAAAASVGDESGGLGGSISPSESVVSLDFRDEQQRRESHEKSKNLKLERIQDDSCRRQFANVEVRRPEAVSLLSLIHI